MVNINQLFRERVEPWQLRKVYDTITEAYNEVQIIVEGLDLLPPLQRQCMGHIRCSFISQALLGLNSPEDGIEVELASSQVAGWSFAEITLNKLVQLTVKSHDNPYTLPEISDFRGQRAKQNPEEQGTLLELLGIKSEVDTNEPINGIIIHKPGKVGRPDFVNVIFPDKYYKTLLGESLNLLELCEEMEAKADQSLIKRRPKPVEVEKSKLKLKKQG